MEKEIKIRYIQPKISKDRISSFWYDGIVMELTKGNRIVYVKTIGNIEVKFKKNENVYKYSNAVAEAYDRNLTDEDLNKLDDRNRMNWFEFYIEKNITKEMWKKDVNNILNWKNRLKDWLKYKKSFELYKKEKTQGYYIGIICYNYDELLIVAKEIINNDYHWE